MTITEIASLVSACGGFLTAIVACVATFFTFKATKAAQHSTELSRKQIKNSQQEKIIGIHLGFQKEIRNLQKKLPDAVNNPSWKPSPLEHRSITLYWYLVFDEWLVCLEGGAELKRLWDQYYSEGAKAGLKIPEFQKKLKALFEGDSTFMGKGEAFYQTMNSLHRELYGKDLLQN